MKRFELDALDIIHANVFASRIINVSGDVLRIAARKKMAGDELTEKEKAVFQFLERPVSMREVKKAIERLETIS